MVTYNDPFKSRYGFDANGNLGQNFADPRPHGGPGADPAGAQDVVTRQYFWDNAHLIKLAGRGNLLPDPMTTFIEPGAAYLIEMDFNGKPMYRIALWNDALTGQAGAVSPGNWAYLIPQDWLKALVSDPDQAVNARDGDFQTTIEQQGKELKVWDNGAWHTIFSEINVRAWIAALSLFEGTVQQVGGATPNVMDLAALPNLTLNTQIDKIAHYWVWQGSPGYSIAATDPSGVGRDLPGTLLNPGDWLMVSNRSGDPAAPDLRWSHVGGDLLAKSRGDNLYGLKSWAAGGWEVGSLVVHDAAIWRATGPVAAADAAPGTAGAPWAKITLAAGIRWVATDGDLPPSAPTGEIYFVLLSAQAGGKGALYFYDTATARWEDLGGGGDGVPLALTGGRLLVGYGTPIGSIIMWATATLPEGYLLCDGAAFDAGTYPELARVFPDLRTPNLVGQFIRGAGAGHAVGTRRAFTTGAPKVPLTGTTSTAGNHNHLSDGRTQLAPFGGNSRVAWEGVTQNRATSYAGDHAHTVTVTGGGDPETAPVHVCLSYIVKALDKTTLVRN